MMPEAVHLSKIPHLVTQKEPRKASQGVKPMSEVAVPIGTICTLTDIAQRRQSVENEQHTLIQAGGR